MKNVFTEEQVKERTDKLQKLTDRHDELVEKEKTGRARMSELNKEMQDAEALIQKHQRELHRLGLGFQTIGKESQLNVQQREALKKELAGDKFEKELAEFEANLDDSKEKIDELETLALETGSAAANIEEEYVDMMDALATDNPSKVKEDEAKPEKNVNDSSEEEDLDEKISVDIDSVPELLEGETEKNIETSEESVDDEPEKSSFSEEPDEEYDYVSMTKAELIELAKKRNLSTSGNKKKIIERLES